MKDATIVVTAALVASGLYVAGARPWHALPAGAIVLWGLVRRTRLTSRTDPFPRAENKAENKKGGP